MSEVPGGSGVRCEIAMWLVNPPANRLLACITVRGGVAQAQRLAEAMTEFAEDVLSSPTRADTSAAATWRAGVEARVEALHDLWEVVRRVTVRVEALETAALHVRSKNLNDAAWKELVAGKTP